ncbi:hypothetical protein [Moorena sp. SIO4G3]|uniref:hypothetical protein n=1 Tax=Moorena sp. SIO4G3 TaxID=2607821 RepID=UPI00142C2232|nr:hypothetical protein [Moorena sp. SIO4G3]NEO80437.1 hypothetical protein [Moorena sp. SIO4G3]
MYLIRLKTAIQFLTLPKIPRYLINSCLLPVASCLSLSDAARTVLGSQRGLGASPGDETLDSGAFIVSRLCRKGLNIC